MLYFNRTLLKQGIITEEEYRRMKSRITATT